MSDSILHNLQLYGVEAVIFTIFLLVNKLGHRESSVICLAVGS